MKTILLLGAFFSAATASAYPGPQIQGGQINPQTGIDVSTLTATGQAGVIVPGSFQASSTNTSVNHLSVPSSLSAGSTGYVTIANLKLTNALPVAQGGTALTSAGGTANRALTTTDGSTFGMAQIIGAEISTPLGINLATTISTATVGIGGGLSVTGTIESTATIVDYQMQFKGFYDETVSSYSASGTLFTVSGSSSSWFYVQLTANSTFNFQNFVPGQSVTLQLQQDGTGSRTITWPTIKWQAGSAPTLTTTIGKTDFIYLFYDGTRYFGNSSLNY